MTIQRLQRYLMLFLAVLCISSMHSCKDNSSQKELVEADTNKQTKVEQISTEDAKKTILCFGNSLTAGFGLDEEKAWPSLLQMRIDSMELNYSVVNAGLSGETTSGGLNRLDWVLNQSTDIFILELGANDMLRGLDVSSTLENLEAIIQNLKAKYPDVQLVICGMLSPPNMGKKYEDAFNGIFPSLAEKYDAVLIPFFLENVAGIESLNLPDGKHPNEEGQKIVLETVWNKIEGLLKE